MNHKEEPIKISFFDKMNALTLSLVTSEMSRLKKVRKRNNYPMQPTFSEPAQMPMDTVTIGGVKIRYAHSAAKGKPTLVMLAPFPQSIVAYAPIWSDFTSRYHLYAYDLPGFGRSEGNLELMTFKAQGEFLKLFVEHFAIENAHFLGPDVGMPSILYYVGMYPNTAKSLLIGDGPAIAPSSNGSVIRKMVGSAFWRIIFRIAGAGALVEAGNCIGYVHYKPNEEELSDYITSYKGRVGTILEWFKGYPESLATVDPLLEKIQTPTKVFWGDEDAILYPDNGERIDARMPNSDLHIFESCGHFCYQDRHEKFRNMVVNWIDQQERV